MPALIHGTRSCRKIVLLLQKPSTAEQGTGDLESVSDNVIDTLTSCGGICLQEIVLFLQKPSTAEWGDKDIESVLARAYLWRASFGDARSHLTER